MNNLLFSWHRLMAVFIKEFVQMRRDRLTLSMLVGIPLLQLILFGFAIDTNPRHLPTVVITGDSSEFTRAFIQVLKNTRYFAVKGRVMHERIGERLISKGDVLFVVNIPTDFTRRLVRGENPQILIEADATNPVATNSALAAAQVLKGQVYDNLLRGPLRSLKGIEQPFNVIIHAKYNPENITQYYIVPGLLGVVLTMTMVMITSLAITRERERGTMESLLATPVRPIEVMIGKITPYILVGYVQVLLILGVAYWVFGVPVLGNIGLLLLMCMPFIAANLAMGLTFSSIAKNQLQSVQMAFFFFLPSILLSGFMFPFAGMPLWAQWIGNILPLTHFIIIVRGILLKGNEFYLIADQMFYIILFMIVMLLVGVLRYRRTLD